jgi:hypothetical protein
MPWAFTPALAAAVDVISVVLQPFYQSPLDGTQKG